MTEQAIEDLIIETRRAIRDGNRTDPMALLDAIEKLDTEVSEYRALFDLTWDANQRAIKLWQAAHPGNDLVWPDHTKLTVWLMDELAKARKALSAIE